MIRKMIAILASLGMLVVGVMALSAPSAQATNDNYECFWLSDDGPISVDCTYNVVGANVVMVDTSSQAYTLVDSDEGSTSIALRSTDDCFILGNDDALNEVPCDPVLAQYSNFWVLRDGEFFQVTFTPTPTSTPTAIVTPTPAASYPIVVPAACAAGYTQLSNGACALAIAPTG